MTLVFSTVGILGSPVHPGEYQLADPPSRLQLDGAAIGVKQL